MAQVEIGTKIGWTRYRDGADDTLESYEAKGRLVEEKRGPGFRQWVAVEDDAPLGRLADIFNPDRHTWRLLDGDGK